MYTVPELATFLVERCGVDRSSLVQVPAPACLLGSSTNCLPADRTRLATVQLQLPTSAAGPRTTVPSSQSPNRNSSWPIAELQRSQLLDRNQLSWFRLPDALETDFLTQICDRGMLDTKCYVPAALWEEILSEFLKLTLPHILTGAQLKHADDLGETDASLLARYDLVLHLRTAADGALDAYDTGPSHRPTPSVSGLSSVCCCSRQRGKD